MVIINENMVAQFAELIRGMPEAKPLDFYHTFDGAAHDSAKYPELNHPRVLEFFLLAVLHDHGFWHGDRQGYVGPMYATINGQRLKGSDALWTSLKRALDDDPDLFSFGRLENVSEHTMWERLFVQDTGPLPFADPGTRWQVTRKFISQANKNGLLNRLRTINDSPQHGPLSDFCRLLKDYPCYGDDPLQKKTQLLAMVLMNRPERFLQPAAGEQLKPIVDYHLMRVVLRLGLVEFTDENAATKNRQRAWVSPSMEHSIRRNVHKALTRVLELSGATPDKLDFALWSARKYCPEMTPPDCNQCRFNGLCAKRTDLFQPVIRTTSY